jgi:hypothetical protein
VKQPSAAILRTGCVVGWITCPVLAMAGLGLISMGQAARHDEIAVLEGLMEPTFYFSTWVLYSREPLRFLWCNLSILGLACLGFSLVQMPLLGLAWQLRTWAVLLQILLAGVWVITGIGTLAGLLLFWGGCLALRQHLDAPRAAVVAPEVPPGPETGPSTEVSTPGTGD